jgi:hypothetical protein
MSKIIKKVWFSGFECFGVVVIETKMGERKAYIKTVKGEHEDEDAQDIAENGLPIYKEHLTIILDALNKKGE